ncbi:hypothetical protein [Flavobacterium sp. MK4S-17]|uniref:hypothetical protein n=1 Tax=Flavobacterium sp. MK4S-17 TaxID=2543737 RepID=UPI00135AD1C9|nr:hypothetical protein [Flavobacterium sp. MK4S-17]
MKKIMSLVAVLCTFLSFGQNFPGEKVDLLTNKQVKVKPVKESSRQYGYEGFYKDEDLKKVYEKKKGYNSDYDALVDKVFTVVSFEPYDKYGTQKFKIKLENSETGTLYYDYNPKFSSMFPFEVIGGLDYPENFFCDRITETETNDESTRRYEFPYADGIRLIKSVSEFTFIFAIINVPNKNKEVEGAIRRGVVIEFDNGEKIVMSDEKLKHAPNGAGGTVYTGIIGLRDEKDLKLLQERQIVKVKLDKFERDYTEGFTLREYAKCFLK